MSEVRRIHHHRPLDDETPCDPRPETIARRSTRCAVCDVQIHAGDVLTFLRAEGEWVHAGCAEEAA